jgi:tight adherence protein B
MNVISPITTEWRPSRSRMRLAISAALVVVLGVMGTGVASASAAKEGKGRERWDIVGENKSSPIKAAFLGAGFPARDLIVALPRAMVLTATQVHVIEDGNPVAGVEVSPAGSKAVSDRYDVQYVSQASLGEREVELSIEIDGVGILDLDYNAPKSASTGFGSVSKHKPFWGSPIALVVFALVAAVLIGLAMSTLLGSRRRAEGVQALVGAFAARAPVEVDPVEGGSASVPGLERLLQGMSWWPRFSESVEIGRSERGPAELIAITLMATVAAAVVIGVVTGVPVLAFLVLPLGPVLLVVWVRHRREKQQWLFGQQLAQHLEELASAMRAGHGLVAGLAEMVRSALEPSRSEWARVVKDEQLGKPLDTAMHTLAVRMDCYEVDQVALVAALHQRTGGNIAEVLDRLAEGVRERSELRRELQALTAQARLSRWVVTALPVALLSLIELIDSSYLRPLFDTAGGNIVLAVAACLLGLGALIMRKLTEVKV